MTFLLQLNMPMYIGTFSVAPNRHEHDFAYCHLLKIYNVSIFLSYLFLVNDRTCLCQQNRNKEAMMKIPSLHPKSP